jgi:hypothetical protein
VTTEVFLHVTDGVHSRPAAGVPVRLECAGSAGQPVAMAGETGDDGAWAPASGVPEPGLWWLIVNTAGYYGTLGMHCPVAEAGLLLRLRRDSSQRVAVLITPGSYAVHLSRDSADRSF